MVRLGARWAVILLVLSVPMLAGLQWLQLGRTMGQDAAGLLGVGLGLATLVLAWLIAVAWEER